MTSAFALIQGERLVSKIAYNENKQIIISRGAEDGIKKKEYIQILQKGRYKARAICIKVSRSHSLWAIYNIYEPLTLNESITLVPATAHIFSKEQEKKINLRLMTEETYDSYTQKDDSEKNKYIVYDESVPDAKSRLNQEESTEDPMDKVPRKVGDSYLEELIKKKNDVFDQPINISLGVAPITFRNIDNSRSLSYRASVTSQGEHEFSFNYSYNRSAFIDSFTGDTITNSRYNSSINYDINRITEKVSLFTFSSFKRQRNGKLFPIRNNTNIGIMGIKYIFLERQETIKKLDLSYIPVVDYFKRDKVVFDDQTFERQVKTKTDINARHSFRLRIRLSFFEDDLSFSNTTFYRPIHLVEENQVDFGDTRFEMDNELSYFLNQNFSFSYLNQIDRDKERSIKQGLPETEVAHTFNFNFSKSF